MSPIGTFETSVDCPLYGRFREQCGHQPPIAGHSDLWVPILPVHGYSSCCGFRQVFDAGPTLPISQFRRWASRFRRRDSMRFRRRYFVQIVFELHLGSSPVSIHLNILNFRTNIGTTLKYPFN
jgi:hypothetical protein